MIVRGSAGARLLACREGAGRIFAALRCIAFALVCVIGLAPRGASAQVLLVLSDESASYQQVAGEVRSGLKGVRGGRLRVDTVVAARLAAIDAPAFAAYELVVTVGLAAAQATVAREEGQPSAPRTLCALIPRQSFAALARAAHGREGRLSAVFIDQPLVRQLDLLRIALPERKRVGVILGPSSQMLADDLAAEARRQGLELTTERISDASGLYRALQAVMPASDLLLMQPDPVATNADSVYGVLLTAYRGGLPVVGFSEGLLNAGALLSLFSTAGQQGRQAGEVAARVLTAGGPLPAPQYPRYFTVRVNASVARSLGLHVAPDDELEAALNERTSSNPAAADVPATTGGNP